MKSTLTVAARCLSVAAVALSSFAIISTSATVSAATVPSMPARQADSLVEAFGVNAHMEYGQTPYANVTAVTAALQALGVRHIRDRLIYNRTDQWAALRALHTAGIKSDLIMGDPLNGGGTPAQLVSVVASQLPGVADSLEGANEWNLKGRPNWAAELRTHQTEVYKQANANLATANIPVLGPALGRRINFTDLGDLSSVLDLGNNHQYPGGKQPSVHIADMITAEHIVAGTKPQIFTESGYNSAVASTVGDLPATEKVGGYYAPKLLLEHYNRGVVRMYNYELLDQQLDTTYTDPEKAFGLLHNNMTPKPAYTSLKNLLKLVADPGPAFNPGTLAYSLTGAPADVRQVLLKKRDGRSYLILWRDISMYNEKTKTDTPNAPVNVTVNLGQASTVSVFRPSISQSAISTVSGTSAVPVALSDDAVAVQVTPGTKPGAPTTVSAQPGNTTATVGWSAPVDNGGAPLTGYTVTASPGGQSVTVAASAQTAVVAGLANYTGYSFSVQAINEIGTSAASAPSPTATPQPPVYSVGPGTMVWGGWHAASSPLAGGGTFRTSQSPGDTVRFAFSGTSINWTALTGPAMGQAGVAVDGIARATVDLYRSTAGTVTSSVGSLTNASHVVVIRVAGTRSAASGGLAVGIDSFKVGTTLTQESDPAVGFTTWRSVTSPALVTSSAAAGASFSAVFTGTSIEWLTSRAPGNGLAQVFIDGTPRAVVDLYSATAAPLTLAYPGLVAGTHRITVIVLGTHTTASTGNKVVVTGLQQR